MGVTTEYVSNEPERAILTIIEESFNYLLISDSLSRQDYANHSTCNITSRDFSCPPAHEHVFHIIVAKYVLAHTGSCGND